jgi:hypothetical protein
VFKLDLILLASIALSFASRSFEAEFRAAATRSKYQETHHLMEGCRAGRKKAGVLRRTNCNFGSQQPAISRPANI